MDRWNFPDGGGGGGSLENLTRIFYKFAVQNRFDPRAAPWGGAHTTRMELRGQLNNKKKNKKQKKLHVKNTQRRLVLFL